MKVVKSFVLYVFYLKSFITMLEGKLRPLRDYQYMMNHLPKLANLNKNGKQEKK